MGAIQDAANHEHADDWSCCVDLTWRMPRLCTGPDGPRHDYDDLSCCHDLISKATVADVVALLREMVVNDYPNGNEWGGFQDRIKSVLEGLPDQAPDAERARCMAAHPASNRCRVPGCTATYYPDHEPDETGWRFSPDEADDIPAHDHYGVAL